MKKHCAQCEHYLPIYDGCGLCNKDALPVTVLCDYEPTKNFLQCQREKPNADKYGDMAYQVDEKTPKQMQEEGWCDGCEENTYVCERNCRCEGYARYKEEKK